MCVEYVNVEKTVSSSLTPSFSQFSARVLYQTKPVPQKRHADCTVGCARFRTSSSSLWIYRKVVECRRNAVFARGKLLNLLRLIADKLDLVTRLRFIMLILKTGWEKKNTFSNIFISFLYLAKAVIKKCD